MELKETVEILKGICPNGFALVPLISNEKEALQTAISHLETLQEVKEAGEVRWKTNMCEFDPRVDIGEINKAERKGWNDCLDAVHADLAGKLEGLEEVFAKTKGCKPNQEDCSFRKCHDFSGCKILQKAIQELFLGKKEG